MQNASNSPGRKLRDAWAAGPIAIPGAFTSAALMVGVAATLLLGVFPAPLLDLATKASEFIR